MKIETLKALLDLKNRDKLYSEILSKLKELDGLKNITYNEFKIADGVIPIIYITKSFKIEHVKRVKLFVGAQHNEFNGLFGILEFLKLIKKNKIPISEILMEDQMLIFVPLMNPFGFLNPTKENKSGYYLKDGSNLNRFWRRIFVPEHPIGIDDHGESELPEQVKIIYSILENYWSDKSIEIYVMDFHETSLLERIPRELSLNLNTQSISYKFDHWLKKSIVLNVMTLYGIPSYRKPLFFKCSSSADHDHVNLSIKQLTSVFEKLLEYTVENHGKMAFYFCHGEKSKNYCQRLAKVVYQKLKSKLWKTTFPAVDHQHDHGCFVMMSDATSRERVHAIELESQKQFFNIFEEVEKSKNPSYFSKKLESINVSLELVMETITEMIKLD